MSDTKQVAWNEDSVVDATDSNESWADIVNETVPNNDTTPVELSLIHI